MVLSNSPDKINLADRVLSLQSAWEANPADPELDRELSLAGLIFGANPFKTAAAMKTDVRAEIVYQIKGIPSDEAPFHILDSPLNLPQKLVSTLATVYQTFQNVFALPEGAREDESDYQICLGVGAPMPAVQIDMAALTPDEINESLALSDNDRYQFLIGKIFEIEGSIAAYGMLSNLFRQTGDNSSDWGKNWRRLLDSYRQVYQKPIVLLATSQEKYESMLGYEFGLKPEEIAAGQRPSPEEVQLITGFDDYWGPAEYKSYLASLPDFDWNLPPEDHPLLYVRASHPVEKMRDPEKELEQPLLGDLKIRRLLRAFSLTTNIDDPATPFSMHINDSKAYMPAMNLAFKVDPENPDVQLWISNATNSNGSGSLKLMGKNKTNAFILKLRGFLIARGIDPEGDFDLRAKPMVDVFGGYGHLKLKFQNGRPGKMNILEKEMSQRGPYVLQPELKTNSRKDAAGVDHKEIWRIFFGNEAGSNNIFPLAGIVNSIPANSIEIRGKVERVHGNIGATFREIKLG